MINDTPYIDTNVFLKSSLFTSKTSDGYYEFQLNIPLISPPNVDILCNLDSFQFTNCFYTVGDYNQYFYYTLSGSIPIIKNINYGFYNIDDLVILLNATITDLKFSWDYYKYKITITSTNSFQINSGIFNCYNLLGFDNYGTLNYNTTFISPYLFNTMATQQLKINIVNIHLNSVELKNSKRDNILCALRVNVAPGEIQNFYSTSLFKYKLSDNIITTLIIHITDQNDNTVNFNGIEWFMNINFSFQYKKLNIPAHYLENQPNLQPDFNDTPDILLQEEQDRHTNQILDEYIYKNHLLK